MNKAKSELAKYLEKEILKVISNNEICKGIYDYAKDTYDIPRGVTSDYVTMRVGFEQANEFVLFCILDAYEKVTAQNKTVIDQFYTMQEAKTYRLSKFEVDKLKFPLKFDMTQIKDDMWIGSIDIQMMMQLRKAQLIRYNANTQRTLQRVIKNDKEIFKISINQGAVDSIAELYRKGAYIPTPFTLNIQQDSDADFYYDKDKHQLIIKSLESVDILDGYHRFCAACKVNDEDPEFNYDMILQIVNWDESKAQTFIWQENNKNVMRKVDSNSLNNNASSNIVVTRLNESSQCNLQGLINRNGGLINFGDLAELVKYFYFKGITKEKEKSTIISTVKELTEDFNLITEYNSVYLEKEYSYKQLVTVMLLFDYYKDNKNQICKVIDEVINKVNDLDNKKFYNRIPKKSLMNEIVNIVKGVE